MVRKILVPAVTALVVLGGCGKESAADRACDASQDMREAIGDVTDELAAGDFGDARNGLVAVREAYNQLRDAVTDVTSQQRDALRPEVDDLATEVAALTEVSNLDDLGAQIGTIAGQAQTIVADVTTTLSCDA